MDNITTSTSTSTTDTTTSNSNNNNSSNSNGGNSTNGVTTTTTTTTTNSNSTDNNNNNHGGETINVKEEVTEEDNGSSVVHGRAKRQLSISAYNQNQALNGKSGNTLTMSSINLNHSNNGADKNNQAERDLNDSFLCPICLDIFKEPFISRCGHSFCYHCIITHLGRQSTCPSCSSTLTREQIFPNFSLNKMVDSYTNSKILNNPHLSIPIKQFQNTITTENISITDINTMVAVLLEKKKLLEHHDQLIEFEILLDFLNKTKSQKMEAYKQLKKQISLLDNDINSIEKEKALSDQNKQNHSIPSPSSTTTTTTTTTTTSPNENEENNSIVNNIQNNSLDKSTNGGSGKNSVIYKKRKIDTHLEDLQSCYFTTYNEIENTTSSKENNSNSNHNSIINNNNNQMNGYNNLETNTSKRLGRGLLNFSRNLSKFTRFNDFKVVTTLKYGDLFNTSSIVSSIEFDKDDEFFATAGVTKKIKIFEFAQLELRDVEVHTSSKEMTCRSKISCLSWNTYLKSQIASSDYEGIITLWDVNSGQETLTLEEHEKRVWSVDFSRIDPTQLASGSDDTRVKIWSTQSKKATTTIESKANICCVKFNPYIPNLIAFGSADHHIHYYDLRHYKDPLQVFKGHRKAVSYVKFMNKEEIISASTDSTLKLWNCVQNECVRTYVGHANEKNFVGLTVNGDYICCGSENNGVYTYYKSLSKPIVTHRFGANSGSGEETDEDGSQFVSSVCWKKDSNILLAANSQGNIKVLELI